MKTLWPEPRPHPPRHPQARSVTRMIFTGLVGLIGALVTIWVAGLGLQWAAFMAWIVGTGPDAIPGWGAAIVAILVAVAGLALAFGCARLTLKICRKLLPGGQ